MYNWFLLGPPLYSEGLPPTLFGECSVDHFTQTQTVQESSTQHVEKRPQAAGEACTRPKGWKKKHMGVSKNRGTPKWMVYDGKPYQN